MKNKIRYEDLDWKLQIVIVTVWIYLTILIFSIIIGFLLGLIS